MSVMCTSAGNLEISGTFLGAVQGEFFYTISLAFHISFAFLSTYHVKFPSAVSNVQQLQLSCAFPGAVQGNFWTLFRMAFLNTYHVKFPTAVT